MWKAALRAGIEAGRDQVERLMKLLGITGIRRGKRTTVATRQDPQGLRHPDHVQRRWNWPTRPDQWWVADFTYVWTPQGFCYVGSAESLVDTGVYAARATDSIILASNWTGVSFPSLRCLRLR
ncbi:hypothetical protein [Glutamicibacter creatinolyticus]|uniref:hypothetical protein n=1 Tax=Glutamicibacter creatinolyticus TaxID=162496 RepID=UPI003CCC4687